MKKILEVLQYGEDDIRFNTDLKLEANPELIPDLEGRLAIMMMTKLWGGNEASVLGVIRALAVADLAVSVNRKEMIHFLDDCSKLLAHSLDQARKAMEREQSGVQFKIFGPNVKPPKTRS